MNLDYALVLISTLILGMQALLLHKVRKIHLASFRLLEAAKAVDRVEKGTSALFPQLQAYEGLMRLIQPSKPLPTLRGWAASPDFLLLIAQHALAAKPQTILECSSGSSTLVLARCCQLNGAGHVWSLEHDESYAEQTRQRLVEQGLADWATVIHAPLGLSRQTNQPWYDVDSLHANRLRADMLVVDGPPQQVAPLARYPALPELDGFLGAGASVFLDDAARGAEQETLHRWSTEFPRIYPDAIRLGKGRGFAGKELKSPTADNLR